MGPGCLRCSDEHEHVQRSEVQTHGNLTCHQISEVVMCNTHLPLFGLQNWSLQCRRRQSVVPNFKNQCLALGWGTFFESARALRRFLSDRCFVADVAPETTAAINRCCALFWWVARGACACQHYRPEPFSFEE